MLALREIIKKSLFFKESILSTSLLDPNASDKTFSLANLPSKATKRWNQASLGYFDPYLHKAYGKGKIVLVGKDVFNRNVVFFIKRLQNLVTFKSAFHVKANITTFFHILALK